MTGDGLAIEQAVARQDAGIPAGARSSGGEWCNE